MKLAGSGNILRSSTHNVNLAAYDRMRVVTTELRRLLGKGRNVQLRLGPKVRLSASGLRKVLRWV